jgi:hypothetical protein
MQVNQEINKIRDDGICAEIKAKAAEMVSNGLQVWSDTVKVDGKVLLGDVYWMDSNTATMHLWLKGGVNAWTIAHEALQGLRKVHEDMLVGPDGVERNLDRTAKYCARR